MSHMSVIKEILCALKYFTTFCNLYILNRGSDERDLSSIFEYTIVITLIL